MNVMTAARKHYESRCDVLGSLEMDAMNKVEFVVCLS